MKLGSKLLLPTIITALVALAGGIANGVMMNREAELAAQAHVSDLEDLQTIADVEQQMGRLHASVYRTFALMASMDEAAITAFRAEIPKQTQGLQRVLKAVSERRDSPASQDVTRRLGEQLNQYAKQADQAIDLASVDPNTGVAAMQSADASFAAAATSLSEVVKAVTQAAAQAQADADQRADRQALVLGLLSVLLTVTAIVISARVLRQLVQALRQASLVAGKVAEGDLSTPPPQDRHDEIGELQGSLVQMVEKLRASLTQVRQAAGSIASASAEIATGNQDLSQRTEQAAGNLQETASSMTQLTNSVRQNADAAAQANQLAGSASAVARRGGEAVSQVVSTMDEIHTASRRIADIIGVIDGIAFQTNILALNAAVEAARAGEQGRGFAVVAGEVRSLAGRSADAAREIKTLIGASVDKVESGSRLVQDAGSTMTDIVVSVQRVTDIIAEITASTVEQRDGIGQINHAVTQLDQMTQQNAALVEESAAAADSMQQQAQRLNEIVSAFQLGGGTATAAAPAAKASGSPPSAVNVAPVAASVPEPEHQRAARQAIASARQTARQAPAAPFSGPPASGGDDRWETF